jgi:hypothetical protein
MNTWPEAFYKNLRINHSKRFSPYPSKSLETQEDSMEDSHGQLENSREPKVRSLH